MTAVDEFGLSQRERQIALAYAGGETRREIGARLFISPATVRTHLDTIFRKLGVSSKIELHLRLHRPDAPAEASVAPARRASLAVMPLQDADGKGDAVAAGLVQDLITRLAKMRAVRVVGRGSVFALSERGVAADEAARLLGVDYLASGAVTRRERERIVSVELADARDGRILWADAWRFGAGDVFAALDEIGDRLACAMIGEIETAERNRALLRPPSTLDAWESFHRGLWHMYRFTKAENDVAQALFQRAVALDPTFARAHAGLSFTHFQNAFLLTPGERARSVTAALDSAGRSLEADERDPAAHLAMGRALWLRGDSDHAAVELRTSVALSPSFAMGHYSLGFVESQSGDPHAALASADASRALSPFDPLLFGMLGSRAMALFRLGAHPQAADCAVEAAARPNAHVHILAIAALCLAAAGRTAEARVTVRAIRAAASSYQVDDFLRAFRFPAAAQADFRRAASIAGLAG